MEKNTDTLDATNFKPMTEGLGLNHFKDGLPYAPAHTRRRATNNVPPKMQSAPVGTKAASKLIAEFDAETNLAATAAAAAARKIAIQPQVEPAAEVELEHAGFVRRMLAYALDVAFASAIFAVVVWGGFELSGFNAREVVFEAPLSQVFWPLVMLYVVVHMGYFLIQETTWRSTIGKALLGMRIRSNSGLATLGRAICFFIAMIPMGIGLIWYFFDSKGRCWHDVITDSDVVKI